MTSRQPSIQLYFFEPEYKPTMVNSKQESLQSKTSSEVSFFSGAKDSEMLCFVNNPMETMATSSLRNNSLGNVLQTLESVNDSISRPGSMSLFGLAEHH